MCNRFYLKKCYCLFIGERITDADSNDDSFWSLFTELTSKLKSLKLLHFFADHVVSEVAYRKVMCIYLFIDHF